MVFPKNTKLVLSKTINSPNYKLGKRLIKQLKHLPKLDCSSIKNSFEMAEKIKNLVLEDDEILLSFDVEFLFSSVHHHGLTLVQGRDASP